ncbi:Small-conductance mechanosensitive channel [Paracoccus chinensis]|uniref:Small-conductance mechanosensitive channel n=2 Tax=Paracoccus chinensis TaxID=525640 RepID=A0A1G9LP81_9RHOB|nr:Small-conductance mechanosensitive channel [Paracoccus chinensis]
MITGMALLVRACLISFAFCLAVCTAACAQDDDSEAAPFAYQVDQINAGLPPVERQLRLDTPRSTIDSYLEAIEDDDFARAAHVLNLSAIPLEEQAEQAPRLALMLAFVLRRHNLIDWSELPDQPDARVLPDLAQSGSPYSRRSIELGEVRLDGRPVPISLQRFQAGEDEPVWLFSPLTVERTPEIFAEIRPGLLGRWIPLEERLDNLGKDSSWELLAAALLLVAGILSGVTVYYGLRALAKRLSWLRSGRKIGLTLSILVAAIAIRFGATDLVLLTGPIASNLAIASEAVGLAAGGWLFVQVVAAVSLGLSRRYVVPLEIDDPGNRRIKTTVYVMRRMALVFVALLWLGYIIHRVGVFDSFGLSVLASAGALGVLVTIAARPLLGNMVAGLQIALTDPLRVGDVVVYDGHWATVEDIAFAHTVLRTWLDTRLIVPHSDFLSKPFENWSKEGEEVRRIVKIPVDYRIEVDQVRRKVEEIVEGDPRSTSAPLVELVEADAETAVLWIWISGSTSFTSWYLHNEIREKVIAFLRDLEDGAYLPRQRHVLLRGDPRRS